LMSSFHGPETHCFKALAHNEIDTIS
jgi:hypothetical protein